MLPVQQWLDAPATPETLRQHVHAGLLTEQQFEQALTLIGHTPTRRQWQRFMDVVLLALSVGLIASGVVFFLAFNWQDLHRFAKLGLVEASIVLCVAAAAWLGLQRVQGKILLTAAAILVGALLAVYGQIYQTGADSYTLFLNWFLLISGFVLIGRFVPLWMLWLLLANITLLLRDVTFNSRPGGAFYLTIFGLNALALLGWEWAQQRQIEWASTRWAARASAMLLLLPLVIGNLTLIFESERINSDGLLLLLLPIGLFVAISMVYFYTQRLFDGLILILVAIALCTCINAWLLQVFDFGDWSFIFMGMIVVGQTASVITWIRQRAIAWEVRS